MTSKWVSILTWVVTQMTAKAVIFFLTFWAGRERTERPVFTLYHIPDILSSTFFTRTTCMQIPKNRRQV